ncbi:MAG: AsmA-like C-terminal region-containing protein [Bacteroidetes bacterium]|nr:AsmA-like C-terminal region-containing protein [Bacteroidota bacterium]
MENISNKERPNLFRRILKAFLWIFVVFVFLIFIAVIALAIYKDDIKKSLIIELNKNLTSEVVINSENIDITFISTFPNTTLEFREILIKESLESKKTDTLIFAQKLNLYFNIKDVYYKKYNITKLTLKDSKVNIKIYKNGKVNYKIFKENKIETSTTNLNLRLENVEITNILINYFDYNRKLKFQSVLNELKLKGNFVNENYDLNISTAGEIKSILSHRKTLLHDKKLSLAVDFNVNRSNYQIKEAKLKLNKMKFNLNGEINYNDSLNLVNMNFFGSELDISSVLSFMPEKFNKQINGYNSTGEFYLNGSINYVRNKPLHFETNFGMKNATITHKALNTKLENVNIKGNFLIRDKTEQVVIESFAANLDENKLEGSFILHNFKDPSIDANFSASMNLEKIHTFIPIDTISHVSGVLNTKAHIKGEINTLKNNIASPNNIVNVDLELNNFNLIFKGDKLAHIIKKCKLSTKNNSIRVEHLSFNKGNSDFEINGTMPGLINYIVDNTAPLVIDGVLKSDFIDISDFNLMQNSSSAVNKGYSISNTLNFKLNANVKRFKFASFEAFNIKGDVELKNKKILLNETSFETMNGNANINAFVENKKEDFELTIQSELKSIDIKSMFKQLNNFGQLTLTQEHVNGKASAEINFKSIFNNQLDVLPESIESEINLKIQGGTLVGFKPMLSLSKFLEVEDLKRIKFSDLNATFAIKNKMITIPKTEINNSALNLSLWGKHSFSNQIDYHVQLLISDYLSKKKKENEFGVEERDKDNKRSAFILMTGTTDNPIIKYDSKGLKEKIKNDIKEEKQTLKKILKEEFNLFKKDTLLKNSKKTEQQFEIESQGNKKKEKTLDKKKPENDEDF